MKSLATIAAVLFCVFALSLTAHAQEEIPPEPTMSVADAQQTAIVANAKLKAVVLGATLNAPTRTPTLTHTPTPTKTETPIPTFTSTSTPTIAPSATQTTEPTKTQTPMPTATMTVEQIEIASRPPAWLSLLWRSVVFVVCVLFGWALLVGLKKGI